MFRKERTKIQTLERFDRRGKVGVVKMVGTGSIRVKDSPKVLSDEW